MNRALIRVVLAASTSLSVITPAMAQEGGDIVVTARRAEERLQDVPISITVFNQEQLANKNVTTGNDLVAYTPSLASNNLFGTDNVTFSIRGFGQDLGTAPSVGMFFADVVAPRGGAVGIMSGDGAGPGSFFDLQNVQVLKGPQGTLFGRNTTGGDILLVPQKPTDKLEGYVEGGLGNYDMRRVQAVINAPLNDTFRVRVGVDHQKRDGYIKNISGIGPDRFNGTDYIAARASIVADLTPDLESYTIVSYSRSKTSGPLNKIINAYVPTDDEVNNPIYGGLFSPLAQILGPSAAANLANPASGFYTSYNTLPNPQSKVRQWQVINTTTWKASDELTVKNIVSYAELKQTLNTSLFGVAPNLGDLGFPVDVPYHFTMVSPAPGLPTANQSTFTEELQFQGSSADGNLTWQAGAYAEISNPLSRIGNLTANMLSCGDVQALECTDVLAAAFASPVPMGALNYTPGKTWYRDYGLYTQASYKLTEQLKATAGIRYTWDKMRVDNQLVTYAFPAPDFPYAVCTTPDLGSPVNPFAVTADDCRLQKKLSSDKPTWLLGLDYTPTQDILVYAKYSRGYRAGNIKVDGPAAYRTNKPEKIDAFEVGVKTSFNGAVRGNFNLAAFYNKFQNQQLQIGFTVPDGSAAPTTAAINAGKSRIYGLEADLNLIPVEGLRLEANYAYLNTKVQQVTPTADDAPFHAAASIYPGDLLPYSPKHKLILGANYTLPLDESIGEVTLGVTYSYTAKQLASYISRFYAPWTGGKDLGTLGARNLVSANVNWNSVGGLPVDLAVFGTNLTKEKYLIYVNGTSSYGFEDGAPGEPRMYGVRLKYHFGGK